MLLGYSINARNAAMLEAAGQISMAAWYTNATYKSQVLEG